MLSPIRHIIVIVITMNKFRIVLFFIYLLLSTTAFASCPSLYDDDGTLLTPIVDNTESKEEIGNNLILGDKFCDGNIVKQHFVLKTGVKIKYEKYHLVATTSSGWQLSCWTDWKVVGYEDTSQTICSEQMTAYVTTCNPTCEHCDNGACVENQSISPSSPDGCP